jgi:hypothetical protein
MLSKGRLFTLPIAGKARLVSLACSRGLGRRAERLLGCKLKGAAAEPICRGEPLTHAADLPGDRVAQRWVFLINQEVFACRREYGKY